MPWRTRLDRPAGRLTGRHDTTGRQQVCACSLPVHRGCDSCWYILLVIQPAVIPRGACRWQARGEGGAPRSSLGRGGRLWHSLGLSACVWGRALSLGGPPGVTRSERTRPTVACADGDPAGQPGHETERPAEDAVRGFLLYSTSCVLRPNGCPGPLHQVDREP